MNRWSNLASVVFKRTYARSLGIDNTESWENVVERAIRGNIRNHNISPEEIRRLEYFMLNRKAMCAGRGLWFSGTNAHERLGGASLINCWGIVSDDWHNFVIAQDLLMTGGGVGVSVEHKYVSKLPKIKKNVNIGHRYSKDAYFIVPDSREGWCELTELVLESFFVTGKSFDYSTVCVRSAGEPLRGFGGYAAGPMVLIDFISKLCGLLKNREGKNLRPIDVADMMCCIGEMVVAGSVRRSAILIQGDPWDKELLVAKRWDLGTIPSYRGYANYSVACDDIDDLHPLFWKTYENGEPFGIVNLTNIRKYGRIGEIKKDLARVVNPCGEAPLENSESCNLQEIFLPNLSSKEEFIEAARLMHRWGKRVTCENFHYDSISEVTTRNRRIGTGITGCLQSELFKPEILDEVYNAIQDENIKYSSELGINNSIRTTVIKPSGTLSLIGECLPGIHPAFSKYYIRRVRFSSNDKILSELRKAGHYMEPALTIDGNLDTKTMVVDFYCKAPLNAPCADEDWNMNKQLDVLEMVQKHWSDQSVSVTVYYYKDKIDQIKNWLHDNLNKIKTISFLCHNDHNFKQAPLESISKEVYEQKMCKIKDLDDNLIIDVNDIDGVECSSGVCPIK